MPRRIRRQPPLVPRVDCLQRVVVRKPRSSSRRRSRRRRSFVVAPVVVVVFFFFGARRSAVLTLFGCRFVERDRGRGGGICRSRSRSRGPHLRRRRRRAWSRARFRHWEIAPLVLLLLLFLLLLRFRRRRRRRRLGVVLVIVNKAIAHCPPTARRCQRSPSSTSTRTTTTSLVFLLLLPDARRALPATPTSSPLLLQPPTDAHLVNPNRHIHPLDHIRPQPLQFLLLLPSPAPVAQSRRDLLRSRRSRRGRGVLITVEGRGLTPHGGGTRRDGRRRGRHLAAAEELGNPRRVVRRVFGIESAVGPTCSSRLFQL